LNELELGGPPLCWVTLYQWQSLGQQGVGVGNNNLTSAEIAFANEFLISNSANLPPPMHLAQDQGSFVSSKAYRLYQRLQAYYELTAPSGGSIIASTITYPQPPPNAQVGVTPEPCTGSPSNGQLFSVPVQQNTINQEHGLTSNGLWVYQVNEARLGLGGQAVNQFLNGPTGGSYLNATPWIWSVIQFDANGNTEMFSQNITNSTTQNLGAFPTYWIYTNGYLKYQIQPSNLSTFIGLNSTFQYGGPQ